MAAFLASFILIFIAEMGDKTQLLALAFASRYRLTQVLSGIFVATLLLNTAAVGAGNLLVTLVPFRIISLVASLSFIGFGLWSLKSEREEEHAAEKKGNPMVTVALAFFLAELGDKTQLAAISLSVEYRSFFGVLIGSTLGMFLADTLGVLAGGTLKKYVPESHIRLFSAALFILFGVWGLLGLLDGK